MTLTLYNTASRSKEEFQPLDANHVRMYVCGPTVYGPIHVGNARPFVLFDTLFRLLSKRYPQVSYVRNITDVDDNINNRARSRNIEISALTAETIAAFHSEMSQLNALVPTVEPRATEHIAEMITMIETLISKGHAYEADGHVLFAVKSMADYGEFSRKSQDELLAGARIDVASYKRDAMDFVLWKPSDADTPGWDSPWGRGRPGWHIECSAMAKRYLGETFDIHAGGLDLIFPHHQNEIAQSHCAHDGAHLAKYWLHNGYVVVDGAKMSKSLGNFLTVAEMLETYPGRGEALRLALLSAHYRQPLDITHAGMKRSIQTLDRWYRAAADTAAGPMDPAFEAAIDDDLNTPLAIARLHALADQALAGNNAAAAALKSGADWLGLMQQTAEQWFQGDDSQNALSSEEIEAMIEARAQARRDKDFAEADRIRDHLHSLGISLEDGAGGTSWRRS